TPNSTGGGNIPSDLRRKVINDAAAYIRSLAETHGRNADWAEQAVRQASNLTAETERARCVPILPSHPRRKVINDAAAYIRSLAETHGRNADWAEQAVRQASNLTA